MTEFHKSLALTSTYIKKYIMTKLGFTHSGFEFDGWKRDSLEIYWNNSNTQKSLEDSIIFELYIDEIRDLKMELDERYVHHYDQGWVEAKELNEKDYLQFIKLRKHWVEFRDEFLIEFKKYYGEIPNIDIT